MKIFLDTANIEEIRIAKDAGLLDGVTTNPTLLAKEKGNLREILKEICRLVQGPVNVEVVSQDCDGMVQEAIELSKISLDVVAKIPISQEGLKVIPRLRKMRIKTNITLVFTPWQAYFAGRAGADYASIFVGRRDDIGEEAMKPVADTLRIFRNYGFQTEVIVASVRNLDHVKQALLIGAPIATVPFSIWKDLPKLFEHPLTKEGLKRFQEDWRKIKEGHLLFGGR